MSLSSKGCKGNIQLENLHYLILMGSRTGQTCLKIGSANYKLEISIFSQKSAIGGPKILPPNQRGVVSLFMETLHQKIFFIITFRFTYRTFLSFPNRLARTLLQGVANIRQRSLFIALTKFFRVRLEQSFTC